MRRLVILLIVGLAGCAASPDRAADRGEGAKVLNHTPALGFVRFVDPRERAFSAEVPQGWRNSGGLFRFASVDTRPTLELVSPEGDVRVTWGDAELPPFTIPNPILARGGFPEGSWYSPGYGVHMMVRRYEPGVVFAEDYVRARVAQQLACSGLVITERTERSDLTCAMNALYAQLGALGQQVREDAGQVSFTCKRNGQAWSGYYLVDTLATAGAGGGVWHAEHILGYAAAAGRVGVAQAAMLRLVRTLRVNPEWERMQQGITMATSQIVAKANEQISSTIRETFQNKWKTQDEIFRRDANARRGTTDLCDVDTGETWRVQNASRYYWRKPGSDVIVGTNTYDPPGVGYQPLQQY